jgi:predicted permease
MSFYRAIVAGLRRLFYRRSADSDTSDELTHWLEQATREHMRRGLSRPDAERAARLEMGSVTAAAEQAKEGGWETGVESLARDVRYGIRALLRNPGFTAIAVATLALGIGANTSMFSVVNAVMLRPLPWRDAAQLAFIWTDDARRGLHRELTPYLTITDWRAGTHSFKSIAYYSTGRTAPRSNAPGGERGRSRIALSSGNLFTTLGVPPLMGRVLNQDDETQRNGVAVITYGFWQRWFNGAPDILGRTLSFDEEGKQAQGDLVIVGVMPADFYFPDASTEVFAPATTYWRFQRESVERFPGWARRWKVVARLNDGTSIREARADMARVGSRLAAVHTSSIDDFPAFGTTVTPALDAITGTNVQSALWVLLGAVTLVLLVACVNVANLLLARGATRQQEIAVRRALGAGRGRLVRQLVVESMVLALVGGALGTLMATWGTSLLGTAAAAYVPRISEITMDWRVFAFASAASVIAGLTFGLAPAVRLSQADAAEVLKEGGRGTGRAQLRRSRDLLVVAECAVAIVLLTGAGLLLRSLGELQSVRPGYDPANVLAVRFEMPSDPPPEADASLQTSRSEPLRAAAKDVLVMQLADRVARLPGVASVGYADDMFINNQGNKSITLPGKGAAEIPAGELNDGAVSAGFFTTLRVRLVEGRYPTHDDVTRRITALWSPIQTDMALSEKEKLATPEPVIVNEAFVKRFFPGESAVGKRFCIDPTNKTYWFEIVGVVADMHRSGLERSAIPEWYSPWIPSANGRADLLVRTSGDPLTLGASVRREIIAAIPGVTVVSISTVDQQLGGFSALRRFQTSLLTVFATLAVLLAAVGIFGLVHYAVAERTREIGVRVALGATPAEVLRLVMSQGMRTPLIGIGLGVLVSLGMSRVLTSLLFGIGATDPATFAGVTIVLALVAASACWLAARRAVRVDPVKALRA